MRHWAEAFGYTHEERLRPIYSMQLAEAKHPDTLAPVVVMRVRLGEGEEPHRFALHPDDADVLADELRRWAQRAREKDLYGD